MFHRLQESIYERLRHAYRVRALDRLLLEQRIDGPWLGSHELLQTLLSVKAILPSVPPILVDVGAHRGAFSRGAQQILGFDRIICVEPDESLLAEVAKAVPADRSSIHHLALTHFDGEADLFVHPDQTMNSLVEASKEVLRQEFNTYPSDQIRSQAVKAATLDSFLADIDLDREAEIFLKLDTQGNELDILRGGRMSLRRVSACLLEFMFCTPYATSYSFSELVGFMAEAGFECRGVLDVTRKRTHRISAVDFLFVKKAPC
jgi:FkbM family methyltransferase